MISVDSFLKADVLKKIKSFVQRNVSVYQEKKASAKELEGANKQIIEYLLSLDLVTKEFENYWLQMQIDNPGPFCLLALAAEYNDAYIGSHIVRMSQYSALLAEKMGLEKQIVENIRSAVSMHDIGKIGISDDILCKPGKLSSEEFDLMKDHTVMGANILADFKSEPMRLAGEIAFSHHEKWDGTGYPLGISGDKIPIAGQIVGLLDVFEAITSERPYKPILPVDIAWDFINIESGDHFSPDVVKVFLNNFDDFLVIKDEVK